MQTSELSCGFGLNALMLCSLVVFYDAGVIQTCFAWCEFGLSMTVRGGSVLMVLVCCSGVAWCSLKGVQIVIH